MRIQTLLARWEGQFVLVAGVTVAFSVTTGFTAGIAAVIVISQKNNFINAPWLVAATIAVSFGMRKISPKIPASLITVVAITIVV